jgi:predicted transcriptional regulator
MKYTILGFSQKKLIEHKLDVLDALILRYFIDFKDTDKMVSEIFENDKYYWVEYEGILKAIPIIGLKKDTVYRRLKKLVEIGILKHQTKRKGGTYSFYSTGSMYGQLIDSDYLTNSTELYTKGTDLNPEGYGLESREGTDLNPEGYGLESRTKDYSINNSSINDSSIKYNEKNYIEELWNMYPNKKGKADYLKKIPKLLEKHGYEQLVRCIERYDKYVKIKRDTGFNLAYKNGSTFFNNGFVDYLDANYQEEKQVNRYNGKPKPTRFHNFVGRQYDEKELEAGLLNNNYNEEIEEDEEDRSAEILNEYKKWKEAERARASSG